MIQIIFWQYLSWESWRPHFVNKIWIHYLKIFPYEKISTSMTINATAPILLAFIYLQLISQGISRKLKGTIQNDILKEYVLGVPIYPPKLLPCV